MLQSLDLTQWQPYTLGDQHAYIPLAQWGTDHWSTLGYAHSRAINHQGVLNNPHLRVNARVHREFAHSGSSRGGEYPTRLKVGETDARHDDVSCLEDMVAAGLLTVETRRVNDTLVGNTEARITLTPAGWIVAEQLARHKAADGNWRDFAPDLVAAGISDLQMAQTGFPVLPAPAP